jgi:hypothetical protein
LCTFELSWIAHVYVPGAWPSTASLCGPPESTVQFSVPSVVRAEAEWTISPGTKYAATPITAPATETTRTLRTPFPTRARRNRFYSRSSAPKRSRSADTMRPRRTAASSSDSVRSGDWNVTEKARDFFPAPTCSPR